MICCCSGSGVLPPAIFDTCTTDARIIGYPCVSRPNLAYFFFLISSDYSTAPLLAMWILSLLPPLLFVLICIRVAMGAESLEAYMSSRDALVQEEVGLSLAGNVTLSAKEIEADSIFFILL